jgi:hypothetical protein
MAIQNRTHREGALTQAQAARLISTSACAAANADLHGALRMSLTVNPDTLATHAGRLCEPRDAPVGLSLRGCSCKAVATVFARRSEASMPGHTLAQSARA